MDQYNRRVKSLTALITPHMNPYQMSGNVLDIGSDNGIGLKALENLGAIPIIEESTTTERWSNLESV